MKSSWQSVISQFSFQRKEQFGILILLSFAIGLQILSQWYVGSQQESGPRWEQYIIYNDSALTTKTSESAFKSRNNKSNPSKNRPSASNSEIRRSNRNSRAKGQAKSNRNEDSGQHHVNKSEFWPQDEKAEERPKLSPEKFAELETSEVGKFKSDDLRGPAPHLPKRKKLFQFNPNTINAAALDSLAVPELLRKSLLGYRNKIAYFRNADELRKLYGMTDSLFNLLENYLVFPIKAQDEIAIISESTGAEKLSINKLDVRAWEVFPGIGEYTAKRIVRYRSKLGGFCRFEQLLEVPLKQEIVTQLSKQLQLEPRLIKQLDINSVSREQLAIHPYISDSEAKAIMKLRRQHGPFDDPKELLKSHLLNEDWFERVSPYFDASSDVKQQTPQSTSSGKRRRP